MNSVKTKKQTTKKEGGIEMERKDIKAMKTILDIQLINDGEVVDEISINFVGPVTRRKK